MSDERIKLMQSADPFEGIDAQDLTDADKLELDKLRKLYEMEGEDALVVALQTLARQNKPALHDAALRALWVDRSAKCGGREISASGVARRKLTRIHGLVISGFAVQFDKVDQHQPVRGLTDVSVRHPEKAGNWPLALLFRATAIMARNASGRVMGSFCLAIHASNSASSPGCRRTCTCVLRPVNSRGLILNGEA